MSSQTETKTNPPTNSIQNYRSFRPLGPPSTVNDRAAMGYSENYMHARYPDLHALSEPFLNFDANKLAKLAEDPKKLLSERIGAATLLNTIGDIRIDVYNPAMITISGGTIRIGLQHTGVGSVLEKYGGLYLEESWIKKECPEHCVNLEPYAIGKYPVTNAEYLEFLRDINGKHIPSSWRFGRYPDNLGNHPVYSITVEGAQQYVDWLSGKTNRSFRLLTEAEWEHAASGNNHEEFPWGHEFLSDHANTAEAGIMSTTPVGVFPSGKSPFGVYDMAGNVEELVADQYAAYAGGVAVDDDLTMALGGDYNVARGGSFTRFCDLARTRRRHGAFPREIYVVGFRLGESFQ